MDLFDKVSKKTLQFKAGSKIFWNGYDHIGAPAGMEQQLAFWRKSQEIFSVSCMTLSTPDEVKVPHQNISKKQTKKKNIDLWGCEQRAAHEVKSFTVHWNYY